MSGSQTLLPSSFNSDTLLSKANSPYLIQGNLTTASGTVLQIEAGVVIRFDAGASLTVNGELYARGTRADSIYFVSNSGFSVATDKFFRCGYRFKILQF